MPYSITDICIGCGACVRVCPTGAISGSRKAQHSIDQSRCIDCGACGRVCPVEGAVLDPRLRPTKILKRSLWPKPVVIRSLCSACSMCEDICPFGCLALTKPEDFPNSFSVHAYLKDSKACVSCGLCADICPEEAIYLAREVDISRP